MKELKSFYKEIGERRRLRPRKRPAEEQSDGNIGRPPYKTFPFISLYNSKTSALMVSD